jgi:aminomethyltransferase
MTVDEYAVTTKSIGILDHSALGKIRVSGKDRIEFLHNILTQDIKNIPVGMGARAALLAASGKVLMLMDVHVFEDHLLLFMEAGMAPKTLSLLEKFVIADDVLLEDVTELFTLISLAGPNSEWLVIKCLPEIYKTLKELQHLIFADGVVLKNSCLGLPGFDLLIPKEKSEAFHKKLLHEGRFMGAKPIGPDTVEILRVEAGVPRYGIDVNENTILSETGLEKTTVSGTKGCYPGQEVIAKIETYSGLHRKIRGLVFDGDTLPKTGSKVFADNGSEIGWITSAVLSKDLEKGLALAFLSKGFFEKTEWVKIEAGETRIAAKTAGLPFMRRGTGGIQERSF